MESEETENSKLSVAITTQYKLKVQCVFDGIYGTKCPKISSHNGCAPVC